MTGAERPIDHNEAIKDFLKMHEQELEAQAIKLAGFYGVDLHELLSRTSVTVWKKWSSVLCALPENESYRYTLRILSNHARNLSRSAQREWSEPCQDDELERLTCAVTTWRDPAIEAIFRDEVFTIYTAISRLNGRCRDVMVLLALGLEHREIRQELGMTVTNLTSTLARGRKSLQEILGSADNHEGGELQ